jgi:hypothetical protein
MTETVASMPLETMLAYGFGFVLVTHLLLSGLWDSIERAVHR